MQRQFSPPPQKQAESNWTSYLWLGAIALVMVFPVVWLFTTALKSPDENIFRLLHAHPHYFLKCAWRSLWALSLE
jgi:carbohydrate ABC transporter membrane protein 2, CUT1 family (TC 3.A.1.1.-)